MKTIQFGILGPGKIAHRLALAFQDATGAKLHAIASRDRSRAAEFAATYRAEKVYDNYSDLAKDPNIDVIYIATPHPFHYEQTLLCLREGKAVLCEKPLAINHKQASEMISLARRNNIFLMEAMWSRFFPATKKALELVQSGVIGEVKYLESDFCFASPVNYESRVYNLALGGGAQLDVGVYPLFLALLFLGKPDQVKSFSHLAQTGADVTTSALLSYQNGSIANVLSSVITDGPKDANIMGTLGRITLQTPWHKSQHVTLRLNSGEVQEFPFPYPGNGFQFQIEEVAKCFREGKKESDLMPHALSLVMAEVSDEIRRQGGVRYDVD